MKFRERRGTLDDSMETVVELADHAALMNHLRALAEPWPTFPPINEITVAVSPYWRDERIGWLDTHIVTLVGYGVLGFTDGPANESVALPQGPVHPVVADEDQTDVAGLNRAVPRIQKTPSAGGSSMPLPRGSAPSRSRPAPKHLLAFLVVLASWAWVPMVIYAR